MNDSFKNKNISKSGLLLKNILDISNVGQRECSNNMGENDQYLRNYIYTEKEIKLGRNFSYNFLAAIYHSLSINRKSNRANDEFDKIIQDKNNLNLGLENKLLIPAIERHILALSKLRTAIFDENQEIIFDNYIQQIFLEEFKEYDEFLKKIDHQREGFKNIENARLVFYEPKNLANRLKDDADLTSFSPSDEDFKKFKKFEKRAESINNFYFVCEKLRENYLPSFYSPTDFKEAQMPYFNKGNFLIKRSIINNLKKSNIIGGEVVIKSGQFSFEPIEKKEEKQKSRWFFGRKEKVKEDEEKILKEIDKIKSEHEKQMALVAEIEKEKEKIINETKKYIGQQNKEDLKKTSKTVDETYYKESEDYEIPEFLKKKEEQLKKWKKLARNNELIAESNNSYFTEEFQKKFLNEREKQLLEMRKLVKKGKNIRLHEIDRFINRYGNTNETRDFINSVAGLKLFIEDNHKNLILDNEEKKLA
ncbi:hypothetical protein OA161_00540 [Candidatus Pelagibacter sp.]|nr:hypothetical protein [Candidatus Pelagibacter sp.]